MDRYLLALYGHLLSLVAAVTTSTLVHVNVVRLRTAESTREARVAVQSVSRAARVLPLAALALLITGLLLTQQRWGWHQGWIFVSVAGLLSMPVIGGAVLKPRIERVLASLATHDGPLDSSALAAIRGRAAVAALNCNHAMALLIMFVMVTKPGTAMAAATLLLAPLFGIVTAGLGARRADASG